MKSNSLIPGCSGWGATSSRLTPDAERRRFLERELAKAATLERLANPWDEIGRAAMARPDHGRMRRAQLPQLLDRVDDVRRGDVAEHAAQEDDVRRHGADVGIGERRIRGDHVDRVETGGRGGALRQIDVLPVELHQAGTDLGAPRVLGQHADQVVPLPRAHADRPDRTGSGAVEDITQLCLHERETPSELRVGALVARVPRAPVDRRLQGLRGAVHDDRLYIPPRRSIEERRTACERSSRPGEATSPRSIASRRQRR